MKEKKQAEIEFDDELDRFVDTSWQIHRQWSLCQSKVFPGLEATAKIITSEPITEDPRTSASKITGDTKTGRASDTNGVKIVTGVNNNSSDSIKIGVNNNGKRNGDSNNNERNSVSSGDNKLSMAGSLKNLNHEQNNHGPSSLHYNGIKHGGHGHGQSNSSLDLHYITEKIISLTTCGPVGPSRDELSHAGQMLRAKHGDNYIIFDLQSHLNESPDAALGPVKRVGWAPELAPPLEKLCALCKDVDRWLDGGDGRRIAVLHAGSDLQRLGTVIWAYMQYSAICGSDDQALDRYSMKRFLDDAVGSLRLPSHRRYVQYFAGLLSGRIRINASPLYLTHVSVLGAPDYDRSELGGARAFLKVYEGLRHVYTTGVYVVSRDVNQFTVNLGGLRLRGDVLVRCYHRYRNDSGTEAVPERELVFGIQFHTCAVTERTLHFSKSDLDHACDDSRFPTDGGVSLHFSSQCPSASGGSVGTPAPTPHVPIEQGDHVTRRDSISELSAIDGALDIQPHTPGPLDGSLYATVANKKPNSPQSPINQQQLSESFNSQQNYQQQHSTGYNNLPQAPSPSSRENYQLTQTQTLTKRSVTSPLTVSMDSGISSSNTGPSSHNRHHTVQHQQNQSSSVSRTHHINSTSSHASSSPPLETPETSTAQSQPSPAEDRHRELDELLNDMMLNVRDIPDIAPRPATALGHNMGHYPPNNPNYNTSNRYNTTQNTNTLTKQHNPTFTEPSPPNNLTGGHLALKRQQSAPSGARERYYRYEGGNVCDFDPLSAAGPEDARIPYHARQDSEPFSYGLPQGGELQNAAVMIKMQSGLSSPSLVRKIVGGKRRDHDYSASDAYASSSDYEGPSTPQEWWANTTRSQSATGYRNRNQSQSSDHRINDVSSSPVNKYSTLSSNDVIGSRGTNKYSNDVLDSNDVLGTKYSTLMTRSNTDGALRTRSSSLSYGNTGTANNRILTHSNSVNEQSTVPQTTGPSQSSLTWLQMQQQKLQARKLSRMGLTRDTRDTTYSRHHRPTASHRADGYTSDTTAFADDDEDFSVPLHVHTTTSTLNRAGPRSPVLPHRTSSRKYYTLTNNSMSTTTHETNKMAAEDKQYGARTTNERPFVAVKRAHEIQRQKISTSTGALNRGDDSLDSGLLSFVENESASPRRQNGTLSASDKALALDDLIASLSSNEPGNISGNLTGNGVQNGTTGTPEPLGQGWNDQTREESSISSWRSSSDVETSPRTPGGRGAPSPGTPRSETPAFPVPPRTPYQHCAPLDIGGAGLPPRSPNTQRRDQYHGGHNGVDSGMYNSGDSHHSSSHTITRYATQQSSGGSPGSIYSGESRRESLQGGINDQVQEVAQANVKFARDTSKYWYKPGISREDAIALIRHQPPGTFVIRDSNSFPNAYGLALKVATAPRSPANQQAGSKPGDELVRHFLIEPTARGVRLKGCADEPAFGSLSALVYQHSLTALALPCRLLLPDRELNPGSPHQINTPQQTAQQLLLTQGAACNVLYLYSCDTEALTGPQAVRKAVANMFALRPLPNATVVHFKVSGAGITLTDNSHVLFFRRHYRGNNISHCGLDPDDHMWSVSSPDKPSGPPTSINRIFAFVARRAGSTADNQCHVFCELEPGQPATAIVSYVQKTILGGQPIPL